MLVSVHLPGVVEAMARGKRRPEEIRVWQRVEIEVREVAATAIDLAASISAKSMAVMDSETEVRYAARRGEGGGSTFRYPTVDGCTAVESIARIEDLRNRPHTVFEAFGMQHPPHAVIHEVLPPVREIVVDHRDDMLPGIARRAREMVVSDGLLFAPGPTPYFSMDVTLGDYRSVTLKSGRPMRLDPGYHTFGIYEMDRLIAEARRHGATDLDIDLLQRCFQVEIHNSTPLVYDPMPAALFAAALTIRDTNKDILHRLSAEQIAAWVAVRDAIPGFMASPGEHVDGLAELVRTAKDLLGAEEPMRRYRRMAEIEATLEMHATRPVGNLESADVEAMVAAF